MHEFTCSITNLMQNVTKYVGDIYRFDPRHQSDEKISRIKMLFKTIFQAIYNFILS